MADEGVAVLVTLCQMASGHVVAYQSIDRNDRDRTGRGRTAWPNPPAGEHRFGGPQLEPCASQIRRQWRHPSPSDSFPPKVIAAKCQVSA
jgi:hypothetical protein